MDTDTQISVDEYTQTFTEDKLLLIAKAFLQNPLAMAITGMLSGIYIEVNDAWNKTLGYSREEILGKTVMELNLWQDFGERDIVVNHISRDGFIKNFECTLRKKSDELGKYLFSASRTRSGNIDYLLSSIIEITEQ